MSTPVVDLSPFLPCKKPGFNYTCGGVPHSLWDSVLTSSG